MVKKAKNPKHIDREQQKTPEMSSKKLNVSDVFLDELKGAFTAFNAFPEDKRIQLYGDKEYLEQFREYFSGTYPQVLDLIDKDDLPVYIKSLEKKGFTIAAIKQDTSKLNNAFKDRDTEEHVMRESLEKFKDFCEDDAHDIPASAFGDFAMMAGFNAKTFDISSEGRLRTIDDLPSVWKEFLGKNPDIKIGTAINEQIDAILVPQYDPTERLMVKIALTKIRKELPDTLKKDFDEIFPLPVTIHSNYQNLLDFKTLREQFLVDHAAHIDGDLAKQLDSVIVTNGDIYNEMINTGRKIHNAKGYSDREQYYRRVFNKFVTRQLFDDVKNAKETIEQYITHIGETFSHFPPYVNQIFTLYPFNQKLISSADPSYVSDIEVLDSQVVDLKQQEDACTDAEEKKRLRIQRKQLQEKRIQRNRQAYISYLKTKDVQLAGVVSQLVNSNFNFSLLSTDQQQTLVTVLVEQQLKDTIKNKVPDLLAVSEEDITAFVHDLFDLKKMNVVLPTRYGPIPLNFTQKGFLGSNRSTLPNIDELDADIKNLPLNFTLSLDESNASYFEQNPIRDSLFDTLHAKNGPVRINDAYKVSVTKDGKTVEGYLSSYCPIDEKYNNPDYTGNEFFLYTHPITSPSDERELVTWPAEEGKKELPVVIKDAEQALHDVRILDKHLNINGDAFGALLFGYVLGQQSMHTDMSPQQEDELAKKLGKLDVYKDKSEPGSPEEETKQETVLSQQSEQKEASPYKEFLAARGELKGYDFSDKQYEDNKGFVKGSRLYVSYDDSETYPKLEGKAWMTMEIVKIDEKKGTFVVKLHGGEFPLGQNEGATKELPLRISSLESIKKTFGNDIIKMPDPKGSSMDEQIQSVQSSGLTGDISKQFGNIKRSGDGFSFIIGSEKGEKVTHFGRYESSIGEDADVEKTTTNHYLYSFKHNSDHTVTLTGDFADVDDDGKHVLRKYSRKMDYPNFLLFVKEKGLQPKTKKQADMLKQGQKLADQETPTMKRGYSINNVISFFKNGFTKIKDGIKKYDDERAEELTDMRTKNGELRHNMSKLFSPFSRVSSAFEAMGVDAFSERDNRVRKKVEKRKKFFEDGDFSLVYNKYIGPMLKGQKPIKPHYKAAAMLLAMINKGKGPYNRNPDRASKGMRVNILMGPEHQQRYLMMRQKLIREMEQGSAKYGGVRTDAKKREILDLEMKYIVHVMDARQLGIQDGDKTKYYFYAKYSQNFINELDKSYNEFFNSPVEVKKDASFDFARAEYFRLLSDRPQQAIPFLKTMATKALNDSQWKIFEVAVMAGMLSGVLLTMATPEQQGVIKKICRNKGFVPGMRIKDINQQAKLQRLLDIFSNGGFSKKTGYDPSKLSFSDFSGATARFSKRDLSSPGKFQQRISSEGNLNKLSKFFKMTGKDKEDKRTLLDIYADKDTSPEDKALIKEFINNTNEKDEELDSDVRNNPTAFTGSILTKGQSVVHQMMRFNDSGFAGKDPDEIQTMQMFFDDMKNSIPKGKESPEQVKIFITKFFNRFEEKGFSGQNKTELIKRLKYCKEHMHDPGIDTILYYSIVGQICNSFHRFYLPSQFEGALLAWKDFFKNNIDTILSKDVLVSSFGGASYLQDYERLKPKLESRDIASSLLDRYDSQLYINNFPTKEQKDAMRRHKQLLKRNDGPYINGSLYELAETLERNNIMGNRFKALSKPSPDASLPKSSRRKATGAKIKNDHILDDLQHILEGKSLDADATADDDVYVTPDLYDD